MQSVLFNETDDESDNSNNGKNKEQDFGNFNCTRGNAPKAQEGGDERNHQKNDGVAQYKILLTF